MIWKYYIFFIDESLTIIIRTTIIDQRRAIDKNNALSFNDFKKLEKRYNKH